MRQKLLVATHNAGKIIELADMLGELKLEWLSLGQVQMREEVAETGATFEENAILKATNYAAATALMTLADDSGLEVDHLHGRPGVQTARFGGEGLTPQQRYELLLQELEGLPWEKRTARFRCVIALADPEGLIGTASGVCEGMIALEPAGSGGFGYDPVFFIPSKGLTMAQLEPAEKHQISHRGRAIRAIAPTLQQVIARE
jgi:XTP/dITP diphosphohydrolase